MAWVWLQPLQTFQLFN